MLTNNPYFTVNFASNFCAEFYPMLMKKDKRLMHFIQEVNVWRTKKKDFKNAKCTNFSLI